MLTHARGRETRRETVYILSHTATSEKGTIADSCYMYSRVLCRLPPAQMSRQILCDICLDFGDGAMSKICRDICLEIWE